MAQNIQMNHRNIISPDKAPNDISEQYHRPSKSLLLENPFHYQLFVSNESDYIFKTPTDVIYAFYGILKEASNMKGYIGGCGSIGYGDDPYKIAYKLLDKNVAKYISLEQFIETFEGTGHVSLLKFYKLPADPQDENRRHFMIEVELITGPKQPEDEDDIETLITYFAYYYGVVTVINDGNGWHIHKIKYYPEDFLCAPYHSWFYDSRAIIQNVYINDLRLLQSINKVTVNNDVILYYCSNNQQHYRLDFIRLTNGHDILLNESILLADDTYREIQLIGKGWEHFKLTPEP